MFAPRWLRIAANERWTGSAGKWLEDGADTGSQAVTEHASVSVSKAIEVRPTYWVDPAAGVEGR